MTWTRYAVGAVTPGESSVQFRPSRTTAPGSMPGVLYCHGAGASAHEALTYPGMRDILAAIADAGHPVLACDLGGPGTWGNDTALARMATAKAYLHDAMGAKPGPIGLVGLSMGGLNSLVWAGSQPALTAFVLAAIPVVDLTDMRTNDRGGTRHLIDTAYGGAYSETAHGPGHNPRTMADAGRYAQTPVLLFNGATDTLCVPAVTQGFASSSGATLVTMGSGHDLSGFTPTMLDQAVGFALSSLEA